MKLRKDRENQWKQKLLLWIHQENQYISSKTDQKEKERTHKLSMYGMEESIAL